MAKKDKTFWQFYFEGLKGVPIGLIDNLVQVGRKFVVFCKDASGNMVGSFLGLVLLVSLPVSSFIVALLLVADQNKRKRQKQEIIESAVNVYKNS